MNVDAAAVRLVTQLLADEARPALAEAGLPGGTAADGRHEVHAAAMVPADAIGALTAGIVVHGTSAELQQLTAPGLELQ